jgi:superfamily II DNA or RNA helicase
MKTAIYKIPQLGQIVEVRQRRYVVADIQQTGLAHHVLRDRLEDAQHLVTLSSVEDDAQGEELQVVWEIEVGTHVYVKVALPSPAQGFDDPQRLDAFLDAVLWGAASLADVRTLHSPFRSGIEIQDYQLDPLVRAVQMPRVNLLIADDVGLGKTIETGLVCQELMLRHRIRKVLIVCPSAMQIQWQEEMRDKFGLEFRIVDSELMKELRRSRGLHANPWSHFPRLITSVDYLKRERPMRLFRDTLEGQPTYPRRYDMLIVDEAHNVAPSGGGRYATDSLRTGAVRSLVPHFEHKIFLTATPHNGYPESFTALLELLDNQRFARGVTPDRDQLNAVMVRRLKSELPPKWDGTPRFPKRCLRPLEVPYTASEQHAHHLLQEYSQSRLKHSESDGEKYAAEFVLKLLKKRLFSCPAAFASTLAQHDRSLLSAQRRGTSSQQTPILSILQRRVDELDEEFVDDSAFEASVEDTVETATRLFHAPNPDEEAMLRELREWSAEAQARPDSKARALIHWLHEAIKPNGVWSDRRVIIFTEYRVTQKWLQTLLAMEGLADGGEGNRRLLTLYGGMPSDQRETVKAAFQAAPSVSPVRILLATDAASEGINLQNHCNLLIHYEIPWNPNRMEQRNGRVDRHGQRAAEVNIYHFVGAGYEDRLRGAQTKPPSALEADLEFLMRAARKVNTIRQDLGKVGPVIATQVEEAMLGRRAELSTAATERSAEPVRRMLAFQRRLDEQIARFRDQLDETRQTMHFTPENVQSIVSVGLELAGQPPLREGTLSGLWHDPTGHRSQCPIFLLPELSGSWASCSEGLKHPHTGVVRPITFDHGVAEGRDDVVLAHLNHRLVQMCLRLLRAEVWASEGRGGLKRVTARLVPDRTLDTPVVVAHGRLVVLGTDGQRLHEEIVTAGGTLKEGRFSRLNVTQTQNALDAALPDEAPQPIKETLLRLWPSHEKSLHQALEARARERTDSLQRSLQERAEKEVADITAILTELQATIQAELSAPEVAQLELELFSNTEREQWERNLNSLHMRLTQIPDEIALETKAIRDRFADPAPRLFPVAVTYLVPERIARQALGGRG